MTMRKTVNLAISIKISPHNKKSLCVNIPPESLTNWCLCLELLLGSYVDSFAFVNVASHTRLNVSMSNETSFWNQVTPSQFEIGLDRDDAEALTAFLMRYFRDGVAEVDHVDVQMVNDGYVIFKVEEFAPPMSQEELMRKLDL